MKRGLDRGLVSASSPKSFGTLTAGLVGRERELARFDEVIANAARGHGRAVVVRGEAGIGKSRLVREAIEGCERAGFATMAGAAEEMEQRRPFGVIVDALGVEGAHDRIRAEVRALLRGGEPGGGGGLADGALLEFRVVELVLEHVEESCARRGVALVVEDLHWADPSSLLAVRRLAHAAGDLRLLLVCTLRPYPERRELRALLSALDRLGAARLELGPLDADAVRALGEQMTGAPPGAGLMRRLEAGGGNPLFVTELLAALAAEGTLQMAPDGSADAPIAALPSSLQLTILHRLSTLPDATLDALRTAAALGSRFAVSDLALALGVAVSRLAESLRPALAAGALVEAGDRLAFRHDLIREALYEDVPLAVRRALHRELGARLIQAGAPVERIAAHMLLGAEAGDREAVEWLRRAGREAAPRAPAVAAELLGRALELTPAGDPARPEILAELIAPLTWSGRGADVEARCREALGERGGGEHANLFRLGLGRGLFAQGRLREASVEFERVARSASLSEHERVGVSAYRAYLGAFLKDRDAGPRAQALLDAAPEGPTAQIARLALGSAALFEGRSQVALERFEEMARAGAADWLTMRLLTAATLLDLDRFDAARELLDEGVRAALEVGDTAALALYRVFQVPVEYFAGRFDAAIAGHERAVELALETGQRWLVASYALRGAVAVRRGDLEGAERDIAAAEAERAAVGPQLGVAAASLARALLAEARGDLPAAAAAVAQALELARRYEPASHMAWHAPQLVRIALAAGEHEQARRVAAAADEAAAILPVASRRGCALLCRGLLADDARSLLAAVDPLREAQRPLDLAFACESAAAALARAGRDGDARRHASEALALYDAAGTAGDADRARSRLRELGLRAGARGRRGRPRSGWESLTAAELRVVALVARGHSNPEIAERLYLTRRTVRAHVSSALHKLDLASRVELAAEVVRRGL